MKSKLDLTPISQYYSDQISRHGPTAAGVDWNSEQGQVLRFEKVCSFLPTDFSGSLLDYGCGYGALTRYLGKMFPDCSYFGYDLSKEMIDCAIFLNGTDARIKFSNAMPVAEFDYVVASGVFNVRGEVSDEDWNQHILESIILLNQKATAGFSFNCLSTYSDLEFRKQYLFYSNPLELFDFCKRNISGNVALLHDYGMYEFTILVRKG